MSTIQNIIRKLQEFDGQTSCFIDCEYLIEEYVFGNTIYPPEFVKFVATKARIHPYSTTCIDFEGTDIAGNTFFISSNNLENEHDAIEQLWAQIKERA